MVFSYKSKKKDKLAVKLCCTPTYSSVYDELRYKLGTLDFIIHEYAECEPNPEFRGVRHTIAELTRIGEEQYIAKYGSAHVAKEPGGWWEEKSKEVLRGDSLAGGLRKRRRR